MNGARGAFSHAFAAGFANRRVDISQIVGYGYRSEWAYACAFAAPNACRGTYLAGYRSPVAAGAGHPHAALAASFRAQFKKMAGTFGCADAAGGAFFCIDNRQTGILINAEGAVVAYSHAVAASEATERASGSAYSDGIHYCAAPHSVVVVNLRACQTATVAFQNGYAALYGRRFHSEEGGNFCHTLRAGYGAEKFARSAVDALRGKVAATLEAAATTVGAGQQGNDAVDARIFLNVEFL